MSNVIVVGVDNHEQSHDAIALAEGLAKATGAEIVLAHVHPFDPLAYGLGAGGAASAPLVEESRTLLRSAAALTDVPVRIVPIAAGSPPHGLHAIAEDLGASIIVVGSSHRGAVGRVLLGSHAESVIAGASCAVAVAPRGLAGGTWSISSIAVGFDGGPEAYEALAAARKLASASAASLRLVGVISDDEAELAWGPYAYVPDWQAIEPEQRDALQRKLDAAADGATTEVRRGNVVSQLDEVTAEVDLLVLGSRAYGPVRRVLLGGTAHRVVRHAACPVLVVPRSATRADAAVATEAAGAAR